MAVITERCIHLFELPDVARPGPCGRYAGGWPTIHFAGLEAQEISPAHPLPAPRCRLRPRRGGNILTPSHTSSSQSA
jgi:hypothetical protein